eukprot:3497597-Alexandrium_andersonii.AAC.1
MHPPPKTVARRYKIACCVEQPASSLVWQFKPIADCMSALPRHSISMKFFGGESCKPLHVRGPTWVAGMLKCKEAVPKDWKPKAL